MEFFKDLISGIRDIRLADIGADREARIADANARAAESRAALLRPAGGAYPASPPPNNVPGMPLSQPVQISNPAPGQMYGGVGLSLSPAWLIGGLVLIVALIIFGGRLAK